MLSFLEQQCDDFVRVLLTLEPQTLEHSTCAQNLEWHLQKCHSRAFSLTDNEIIFILRRTAIVKTYLPSWEPFLVLSNELLTLRYNRDRASQLLANINVPKRDTIYRNTGNLPNDENHFKRRS